MNDEQVDDLLRELDAALAVQPSPAVAAKVRTRIADQVSRRRVGWRVLAGGGAVVAASLVVFAMWPRAERQPPMLVPPVATASAEINSQAPAQPTSVEASEVASVRRQHRPVPVAGSPVAAAVRLDPEVIVSPDVRLGFEQLQAAAAAGRVTAETFQARGVEIEPTIVTPAVVVVQPFTLDRMPGWPSESHADPGTSTGEDQPVFPTSSLSQTRSTV